MSPDRSSFRTRVAGAAENTSAHARGIVSGQILVAATERAPRCPSDCLTGLALPVWVTAECSELADIGGSVGRHPLWDLRRTNTGAPSEPLLSLPPIHRHTSPASVVPAHENLSTGTGAGLTRPHGAVTPCPRREAAPGNAFWGGAATGGRFFSRGRGLPQSVCGGAQRYPASGSSSACPHRRPFASPPNS